MNDTCPICLAEFIEQKSIFVLNCHHQYCIECIDELIKYSKRNKMQMKCPMCMKDIDPHITIEIRNDNEEQQQTRSNKIILCLATTGLIGIYLFAFIYGFHH